MIGMIILPSNSFEELQMSNEIFLTKIQYYFDKLKIYTKNKNLYSKWNLMDGISK